MHKAAIVAYPATTIRETRSFNSTLSRVPQPRDISGGELQRISKNNNQLTFTPTLPQFRNKIVRSCELYRHRERAVQRILTAICVIQLNYGWHI